MSNSAKWNQTLKICGITKLKSDIILLSDIRISNKNLISAEQDLKNMFLHNPYERYNCYFNSTKNKRGVAILIKYELQYEVLSEIAAADENSLLLHLNIQGNNLCVISVYGPNNTDVDFFIKLEDWIRQFTNQQVPVIIGGDFNCTYSSDPVPENIDCLNMTRPPNITHSKKINEICDQYNLVDPYRLMNPDLQEFTYSPRSIAMKNQSRLDFFLVSETILDSVSSCKIAGSLQNKLFDHKAVTLTLNEKNSNVISRPTISNKDLKDDLLDFVVQVSAAETYLIHCPLNTIDGRNKHFLLNTCGTIRRLIRDCGPPSELCIGADSDPEAAANRERKKNRLQVLSHSINLNIFDNIPINCEPDVFF
jgi:exonuclease III